LLVLFLLFRVTTRRAISVSGLRLVLLYFLFPVRNGAADSSASRIESGKRVGAGGRLDSFPGSRVALLGRPGAAGLAPIPLIGLILAATTISSGEARTGRFSSLADCIFETVLCLLAGWMMWRSQMARRSHGAQLLAGIFC